MAKEVKVNNVFKRQSGDPVNVATFISKKELIAKISANSFFKENYAFLIDYEMQTVGLCGTGKDKYGYYYYVISKKFKNENGRVGTESFKIHEVFFQKCEKFIGQPYVLLEYGSKSEVTILLNGKIVERHDVTSDGTMEDGRDITEYFAVKKEENPNYSIEYKF